MWRFAISFRIDIANVALINSWKLHVLVSIDAIALLVLKSFIPFSILRSFDCIIIFKNSNIIYRAFSSEVERLLCMLKVMGSIPIMSNFFEKSFYILFIFAWLCSLGIQPFFAGLHNKLSLQYLSSFLLFTSLVHVTLSALDYREI